MILVRNLRLAPGLAVPPRGVYAVEACGARAVANFGIAPTAGRFAWEEPVLELHFPHGVPDGANGPRVEVRFLRFVRAERAFASIDELKAQISRDISLLF